MFDKERCRQGEELARERLRVRQVGCWCPHGAAESQLLDTALQVFSWQGSVLLWSDFPCDVPILSFWNRMFNLCP